MIASDPLEQPTALGMPRYSAHPSSSAATLGPPMKTWLSSTSCMAGSISSRIAANCAFRSRSGTVMAVELVGIPEF